MTLLLVGLVMFLGVHSVRIVAEGWRTRTRARVGEGVWKGAYSVLSVLGLVLIVWGYGQARQQPVELWPAPVWGRHAAALLTLLAFVLVTAAYVPGNGIKARVGDPMVLGVLLWAVGHLLANSTAADVLLFGAFGLWAMLDFGAARHRTRAGRVVQRAGSLGPTLVSVVVGVAAWALFAFWGHGVLIGVRPFG
ncbi:MAG: NnrU family protein [Pseudomonadota bacterium]|nr:NnrU family protein [Pseudomonadota bacterium]